jgi:hypothetical protein
MEKKRRVYARAIPEKLPCGCKAIAGEQYGVIVKANGERVCRHGHTWSLEWNRKGGLR